MNYMWKARAEAKQICKNTLAHSILFYIEDIPLCLIIYKVNKLFIVAVKNNNTDMFHILWVVTPSLDLMNANEWMNMMATINKLFTL